MPLSCDFDTNFSILRNLFRQGLCLWTGGGGARAEFGREQASRPLPCYLESGRAFVRLMLQRVCKKHDTLDNPPTGDKNDRAPGDEKKGRDL